MTLIVDFDSTFLKNDFFKEAFYKKLIENPFFLARHFLIQRRSLLDLKIALLKETEVTYPIDLLINAPVLTWINENKEKYDKLILVSATPDFFVRALVAPLNIFDEVYGSTTINLKGHEKLRFIKNNFGGDFIYIGDSKHDVPIFKESRIAIRVTPKGLMHV